MDLKEIYADLFESEKVEMRKKDIYTDCNGIANSLSFDKFTKAVSEDEELYLIACNIDLRKSNSISKLCGNRTMRNFYFDLKDMGLFVFRIQGEKFNIFCPKNKLPELQMFLDKQSESYDIYYGISDEPFDYFTAEETIAVCKERMYSDKRKKHPKAASYISDEAEKELQPLYTLPISNLCFSLLHLVVQDPYIDLYIHIFPLQIKKPMTILPIAVVIYDMVDYKCFVGDSVHFDYNGCTFMCCARYTEDGDLSTVLVNAAPQKKLQMKIEIEDSQAPQNANASGIGIGKGKLFPLRKNIYGTYDFVYVQGRTANVGKGTFELGSKHYAVYKKQENFEILNLEE